MNHHEDPGAPAPGLAAALPANFSPQKWEPPGSRTGEAEGQAESKANMNILPQTSADDKRRATLAAQLARRGYVLHGPATGPLMIVRWSHAIDCANLDAAEHRARRLGVEL